MIRLLASGATAPAGSAALPSRTPGLADPRKRPFLILELNLGGDAVSFSIVDQRLTSPTSTNDRIPSFVQSRRYSVAVHGWEIFANSKYKFPYQGDIVGRDMKLKDKLQMLMARQGLNGQKLARLSQVSDSEISRILQGKSRPGLDNAARLAKAVGVSLDYLADDTLEIETAQPEDSVSPEERRILNLIEKIGRAEALTILENVRFLGYETAMSRLVGAKPIIEIDKESAEIRSATASAAPSLGAPPRVASATA
jgi:transcriptional regulator with XRE-family HTH domain